MIRLNLLGDFQILFNDIDVTTKLSKKGIGLLVYMATHPEKLFNREKISGMFWSNYRKDSALNNLRYTLWHIRKIAKESGLETLFENSGKHAIKINSKLIACDYLEFFDSINLNNHLKASALYTGDFLESFYLADVPDFSDWVFNERESVQKNFFDTQLHLAKLYAQNDSLKEATSALERLIEIDPLNEIVYYNLIHYHYLSGNKVTAINTYRSLKQVLRDELNISPSDEIQRLFCEIMDEAGRSATPVNYSEPQITTKVQPSSNCIKLYINNKPEILNLYALKLSEYTNSDNKLVIDICDSPGLRINYEGLFEILDDLIEHGKYDTAQSKETFARISSDIKNEHVKEDLFLFGQFELLLKNEGSDKQIFRIWNLHFLDAKTIDFLSYIYRKKIKKQIVISGIYDDSWNNLRLENFIKAHEAFGGIEVARN